MSAPQVQSDAAFKRCAISITSRKDSLDRITRLAVRTLKVPIAVISLHGQEQPASVSGASQLHQEALDCLGQALTALGQQILSSNLTVLHGVDQLKQVQLPTIAEQPIEFFAGVPLVTSDGFRLGSFCIADTNTRELSSDEAELLHDLAALAIDEFQLQEVTEQAHQSAALLHRLEGELSTLHQSLTDVVLILNDQGQFLTVAPTKAKISPLIDQIAGKTLREVFDREQADLFLSLTDYALKSQDSVTVEYKLVIEEHEAWFAATISPLTEDTVLWVAQDVSDREHAQAVLADSAAQIRLIIDSVPARIAYIGRDLRYRFVNRQYEDWFHIPATDIVGKHVQDLLGRPIFQANLPLIEAVLAGEEVTLQDSLLSPDGIEHHFQVSYVPNFGKQGNVLGYYVLAQDITDHKRVEEVLRGSEAELRALFSAMTDLIFVLDRQGRYLKIAPTRPDLLYSPAEDLIGKTVHEVLPLERAQACLRTVQTALDLQQTVNTEYRLDIGDRSLWFSTNVSPLSQDSVICVARDITSRKQAELQLTQSLHEKEALLQEIHHRVKNNLQIMSSLLDLQAQFALHPAVETAMAESQNRLRSMALIHEHLYHSQTLNQINLPNYVEALVSSLVESYATQADQIHFQLQIQPLALDIDQVIPCGLIINELVSNALNHGLAAEDTGYILVRLFEQAHQVVLVVSNSGAPFPDQVDFRQAKTLGLQLVNTLVLQLEGSIELEALSTTTFRVKFPVVPVLNIGCPTCDD